MTTKFTASNGVEIETTENGEIFVKGDYGYSQAGPAGTKALREFFQHERDQELGRWRDPVNPDLVVYRRPEEDDCDGRAVAVLDASTGVAFTYWEKYGLDGQGVTIYEKGQEAAGRYFAAHPVPRPWDEAEPGEIWELTAGLGGIKKLWVKTEREGWRSVHSNKTSYRVDRDATAGRRIWPEED